MKRLSALIMLLFVSSSVLAAPPSLTLPARVSGQPGAFLTVAAQTSGKNVAWLVIDPGLNLFPVSLLKDSKTAVVTSGVPGKYRLLAVTAAGDEVSQPAVCEIVIEGTKPAPVPAPTPVPTPPAPPAAKVSWAIVVLDNSKRTPAVGQLVSSPTLLAALQQRGISYRVLDVNDPLVMQNHYEAAVQAAGGTPALLLYAVDGTRVRAVPLPADVTGMVMAISGSVSRLPEAKGRCPS